MPDSATERSRLAPGSTLDVILLKRLGHAWPPLTGSFDALNAIWERLRGYRVAHPATVNLPAEGIVEG
jgi:hypothetical protein